MPSLIWSRALTANQLGDTPIAGWQFERVPGAFVSGAYVSILQRATTVDVVSSIFTGSQNIQQRSPVPAGGTTGTIPVTFNTPMIDFQATPDDLLSILNDEIGGNVANVDGIITIEPM